MTRTTLRTLSAIELTIVSFLIFRCDSINIPEGQYSTSDVTTINSYIQDSTFTCPDNPCPGDTYTLNKLYFKLIPEIIDSNTVAAPLPILSVLSMLTENAADTNLKGLRSKIPYSFLEIESAIQQNTSWHNSVNMESIFWGQSNYLFSTPFLNTLSLCKKARLKVVDFAWSGYDFLGILNGYLNSLSGTFEHIPFHEPDQIDSMRALFTSTFCVNTSFDSCVVEDTNCEGTFKDIFGVEKVTKGIKFKKGLKTYHDSTSIVYEIALNDTSLRMYVLTGIDTCFQSYLQKILDKEISFNTDTIAQLWLPFVSIKHEIDIDGEYDDNFNKYFSFPINVTLIDYSYINHSGALQLSNVTSGIFFSLSSSLTVVSNAAIWLKATSKENLNNWNNFLGVGIDADCHYIPTFKPECKPFMIVLIHKMTNSVLTVAYITTFLARQ